MKSLNKMADFKMVGGGGAKHYFTHLLTPLQQPYWGKPFCKHIFVITLVFH